ncbi:MAG: DDE-type integrase/transposase/recombinase [Oscillospiraceae bacterium]|nr:DDE-type integrase/transposase/recombinase [Oscillospiraceae bacterium]
MGVCRLYLYDAVHISPVMDCFNGEIVALEMRDNMKNEFCVDTVSQLGKLKNAIHNDRGSQYTIEAFRDKLKKNGIIQSLNGTGRCYVTAT